MTQAGRWAFTVGAGAVTLLVSAQAQAQARGEPVADRAAVAVHAREARVLFESSPDHLAIYRSSYRSIGLAMAGTVSVAADIRGFQRICVAPCDVSLAAGTDTLAVSQTVDGESWPLSVGAVTFPAGASSVRLDYHDRSVVRHVGGWLFGSGLVAMSYSLIETIGYARCRDDVSCKDGKLRGVAWGGGLALGAFVVGGIMLGVGDMVEVKVTPRAQAYVPGLPRGRGLALRGSF